MGVRPGDVADGAGAEPVVLGVVSGIDGRVDVVGGRPEGDVGFDASAADSALTSGESVAVPGSCGAAGRSDVEPVVDPDDPHDGVTAKVAAGAP